MLNARDFFTVLVDQTRLFPGFEIRGKLSDSWCAAITSGGYLVALRSCS